MEKELDVELDKANAEKIYNSGGKITVNYVYVSPDGIRLNRKASFLYTSCGLQFSEIEDLYKRSFVEDILFSTDGDTYNAGAMCDFMCN